MLCQPTDNALSGLNLVIVYVNVMTERTRRESDLPSR